MADMQQTGTEQYWAAPLGAPRKFDGPEPLWAKCVEYFEWNKANPLKEQKHMSAGGKIVELEVARMRAMTIGGLCLHLNCTFETWCDWRKNREDLSDVITRAEAIIRAQKFEGASADLLNANIIARDLGLADKRDLSVTPPDLTDAEQAEQLVGMVPVLDAMLRERGYTIVKMEGED